MNVKPRKDQEDGPNDHEDHSKVPIGKQSDRDAYEDEGHSQTHGRKVRR